MELHPSLRENALIGRATWSNYGSRQGHFFGELRASEGSPNRCIKAIMAYARV